MLYIFCSKYIVLNFHAGSVRLQCLRLVPDSATLSAQRDSRTFLRRPLSRTTARLLIRKVFIHSQTLSALLNMEFYQYTSQVFLFFLLSFIEAHFVSLSGTEEFLQLSSTELEQFIRRDTLNVLNEEQVCPFSISIYFWSAFPPMNIS